MIEEALENYPKMKWFGPNWHAPVNGDTEEMPVPIGEKCTDCQEPFDLTDQGFAVPHWGGEEGAYVNYHRKCFLNEIIGPELGPIIEKAMEAAESAPKEEPPRVRPGLPPRLRDSAP